MCISKYSMFALYTLKNLFVYFELPVLLKTVLMVYTMLSTLYSRNYTDYENKYNIVVPDLPWREVDCPLRTVHCTL